MLMVQNGNNYRTAPMYSFSEASRLAGVSTSTVKNWLFGYSKKEAINTPVGRSIRQRQIEPLFNTMPPDAAMVTFLQLIEIVVAGKFRLAEHRKFQVVKQAYDNAQKEYQIQYPFAHLELRAIGGHIVELMHGTDRVRSVDSPAQLTLPNLVFDVVEQLDYGDDNLAFRWFPTGKDNPIVVDPKISAGLPTFEGRGVTINALHWRWKHEHQSIEYIARDFRLPKDKVEQALQYAENIAA